MNRETIAKLRVDRRLIQRRGWISPEDLEREIESLPDVSDKAAPREDAESASEQSRSPEN